MEKTNILLISTDKNFAERMIDCVRRIKTNIKLDMMSIDELFCDKDESKEINSLQKYKIVLVDVKEEKEFENIRKFICENALNQKVVVAGLKESYYEVGENFIYKYDKISEIISKSIQIYAKATGDAIIGLLSKNERCKIYCVSSLEGGSGCSSIAMGIARDMALLDCENILYISLGQYHQERLFFKWNRRNSFREYLYHMFYGNINYCNSLESYINRDEFGVYAFNTSTFSNKLSELSTDKLEQFMTFILSTGKFDKIVVDVGNNLSIQAQSILSISDKNIYVIENLIREIEDYKRLMNLNQEDTIFIKNKVKSNVSDLDKFFEDEETEENFKWDFEFEYDKNSFEFVDNLINIRSDMAFGNKIRELAIHLKS